MYTFFFSLLMATALLVAGQSQAQQTPVAPDSTTRPAISPATVPTGAATDVIVRTNGDELPARVLRITPQLVRYLPLVPAPDSLGQATAAAPDTLQLAATDVFMIRYANGTREVMRPILTSASALDPRAALVGLSGAQRYERGRQDSRRYYKPAQGVFWGTFAGTVATASLGGLGGITVGAATSLTPPSRANLRAPEPALLNDRAYSDGYIQQAKSRKLGKAAAGYGVGMGTVLVLVTLIVLSLSGGV